MIYCTWPPLTLSRCCVLAADAPNTVVVQSDKMYWAASLYSPLYMSSRLSVTLAPTSAIAWREGMADVVPCWY
eukprot:4515508-Amphidinium_carterae.1